MAGYSFWNDPNLEPKRSFRFLLYIGGIPQWLIKSTKKPSYTIGEIEHAYLNHTFYYPGRLKWDPIDVVLVDPMAPDAAKTIMDIITNSGYHFPVSPDDTSTISKAKAVAALGNVSIYQVDAEGNPVEEWQLKNAWISKVEMGDLAYEDDKMIEMKLTIRFDYAKMEMYGTPVPPGNK